RKYESRSEQWWWLEFFELLVWGEEAPKPAQKATQSETPAANNVTTTKPDVSKQTPVGIHGNPSNGYFSADGQNTCNLIMERPSTKVHSAPGGGSSLGYLFGGGGSAITPLRSQGKVITLSLIRKLLNSQEAPLSLL
ncbi:hypothetical protein M8C21_026308, partial [Ambrosia artemisiifolia]